MNSTKRIMKKHVGRPVDFTGWNRHEGIICHGRIDDVKRGFAVLGDVVFPGDPITYQKVLLPVRCDHIVAIH